jgi:hypothetical protein
MVVVVLFDGVIGDTFFREVPGAQVSVSDVFVRLGSGFQLVVVGLAVLFWLTGRLRWLRMITFFFVGLVTLALVLGIVGLIFTLRSQTDAYILLRDAALLWLKNILVFSIWYWLIDAGGPEARAENSTPARVDFSFPQQSSDLDSVKNWRPVYFDYFFLAFSHSTAFSPTDTVVFSKRAKALVMLQAGISLVILAMIAARAINIIEAA